MDANEGWKNKEEVVRKILWLETQGVEFVEQPMPASMLEETRWVRSRVHVPIIADEACLGPRDFQNAPAPIDGVNIKLDKCGGILEAYRMIQIAKALGMKTMLGCMISSSISVHGGGASVAAGGLRRSRWQSADRQRPVPGVPVENGKLILPEPAGTGVGAGLKIL